MTVGDGWIRGAAPVLDCGKAVLAVVLGTLEWRPGSEWPWSSTYAAASGLEWLVDQWFTVAANIAFYVSVRFGLDLPAWLYGVVLTVLAVVVTAGSVFGGVKIRRRQLAERERRRIERERQLAEEAKQREEEERERQRVNLMPVPERVDAEISELEEQVIEALSQAKIFFEERRVPVFWDQVESGRQVYVASKEALEAIASQIEHYNYEAPKLALAQSAINPIPPEIGDRVQALHDGIEELTYAAMALPEFAVIFEQRRQTERVLEGQKQVQERVDLLARTAEDAAETASHASGRAEQAVNVALEAQEKAEQALRASRDAVQLSSKAQSAARSAKSTARSAKSTARSAKSDASFVRWNK